MRHFAVLVAATMLLVQVPGEARAAAYRGETVICQFPAAGKVTLDTREPGASITHRGTRYPATSGSYFYQTESAKVTMAFNPPMTKWTLTIWNGKDPQPEKARRCIRKKNRR